MDGSILITGNGTLTRAILRQAARDRWDARFTVFSRSESRLALLKQRYPHVRTVVGDVRDASSVSAAIAGHDIVIHGAALKRIPECEAQPDECFETNARGSLNVARACLAHGVAVAVGISTDKACRAATVYGASKLLLEGIWKAQPAGATRFVGVRYGNVVASTGSVIPIWRQQYREGKPLTITDRRMTRFWMSPTEAVRLICEAVEFIGQTPKFRVPKMGALSIPALADIICPGAHTSEVGLRSTEKLHEDLVHTCEMAAETVDAFFIGAGELGHHYDSATCRHLKPEEFHAMLADAEDLEDAW